MLVDREELIKQVNGIPKFTLRNCAVKKVELDQTQDTWFEQENWKAVTEVDNFKSYTFVSKGYVLVQFAEVFLPILNTIPECEGELVYDNGFAYMYVYPKGDKYKDEKNDYGIVIINSVNGTAGVIIKFIVRSGGRKFILPDKISGFNRTHKAATVMNLAHNFIINLDKVREMWEIICTKFNKEKLNEDYINAMGFDESIQKKLKKELKDGKEMNLWDAFVYALDYVSSKTYKTEVHKRKKLDKICETIIDYGLILKI